MPKAKIMIVEDEYVVARDIQKILENLGYEITAIEAGANDALKKAEQTRPDLALVDIVLRGEMDGIQAAEQLRSRFNIPVIFLTAYVDEKKLERAKAAEPFGYLTKPFKEEDLKSTIEMALFKAEMETKLRRSEERYRSLIESTDDPVYLLDRNMRFLYANRKYLSRHGYSPEEIEGLEYAKCHSPQRTKELSKKIKQVLESNQSVVYEHESEKDRKVFLRTISPVKDPKTGEISSVTVISKDITGRRRAEKALRTEKDNLVNMFEAMEDGVYIVDRQYDIQYVNNSLTKDFGAYKGLKCYEYFHDRQEVCPWCKNKDVFSGKTVRWEWYSFKNDKTYDLIDTPLRNPDGSIYKLEIFRDITERKRAEEALRESRDRYELATRAGKVGVWDWNIISGEFYLDPVIKSFLGYSDEEIPNDLEDWVNYVHPDDRKPVMQACKDCLEGKTPDYIFEHRMIHKDGSIRWVDVRGSVIRDAQGNALRMFGTDTDITGRKQAEEEFKKIEKRYRDLVERAGIAIIIDDKEGNFEYFNEHFAGLFGYSTDEMKKLSIRALVHPDDIDRVIKYHRGRINGKQVPSTYECKGINKDGTVIYLRVDAVPYKKEGKIVGSQSYLWDITERKQAEEALRERQNLLQTILDNINSGVVIKDTQCRYLLVNHKMEYVTGKKTEDIIGKTPYEIYPPEIAEKITADDMQVIESGKPLTVEEKLRLDDDSIYLTTKVPLFDVDGKSSGLCGLFTDITERKQAEEELKKSREKLRNLSAYLQKVRERERKAIAREIHDELGQALTAMKIDLALLGENIPEKQKKLISQIESISELIDVTLERVKQISRDLRPDMLDDLGLIPAIEWQVSEYKSRTRIACELSLPPEEPDLDKDLSLSIFRVFQESMTNVARHAKATKVKISLKKLEGVLELVVKDNGAGITEKDVASSTSLGLIGMQERVNFWGGALEITGARGKGTTIKVTVPIKTGGTDAENNHRRRPPDSS